MGGGLKAKVLTPPPLSNYSFFIYFGINLMSSHCILLKLDPTRCLILESSFLHCTGLQVNSETMEHKTISKFNSCTIIEIVVYAVHNFTIIHKHETHKHISAKVWISSQWKHGKIMD
jgi:hypothetical protein